MIRSLAVRGASRLALLALGVIVLPVAVLAAEVPKFRENLSWGAVDLRLETEPAVVHPDRDLLLTLTATAPAHLRVTLPDLRRRFSGFAAAESYSRDPVTEGGQTRQVQRWRLTPELARTYRLAPFAVEVRDTARQPPEVAWFATRPVLFPAAELGVTATGDPEVAARPRWIAPTGRAVLGWVGVATLALAVLAGLVWGLRHLRQKVREMRMSPRERALAELDRLLRRDLVGQGLFKDFYVELTQVVRRYIERAHGIRAPEQTTEEFLGAAVHHPHFTAAVLQRLRAFLESADLVKFAGQTATPQSAAAAVDTAKAYLDTDVAPTSDLRPLTSDL